MSFDDVHGIVLHRKVFFEQDLLLEVFTQKYGKLKCIAKSAAKMQSKLAGKLNPLNVISLQLYKGKAFYTITGCHIVENVSGIRDSFNYLQLALFAILVCRETSDFNQSQPELYHLLLKVLQACNESKEIPAVKAFFYEHFLRIQGLTPPDQNVLSDQLFIRIIQEYCEKPIAAPLFIENSIV